MLPKPRCGRRCDQRLVQIQIGELRSSVWYPSMGADRRRCLRRRYTAGDRAIEIEFAAGARMRITGAVDAVTLKAAVAALAGGRSR
jgi:hypothetical protein